MTTLLIAVLLLALSVAGVVVRKTYDYVPIHEMKRLAHHGDVFAAKLYPVAAFQTSLRILLGVWIALTAAGGFVLLARVAPLVLSLLAVAILLLMAFIAVPSNRIGPVGERLTVAVTPTLFWILNYLYPILSRISRVLHHRFKLAVHTGMFERQDFVAMIERQQAQYDNRLSPEELEIAKRALTFDEYTVSDILIPRKDVRTVLAEEMLGPILIDELHKSDQKHVLVRQTKKGEFLGTLDFAHLDLRHTGKVSEIMSNRVYYVHEDDTLAEALHAFFTTNHPIFVVVNSSEEYVGILTVESILRQLLGHIPGDNFDRYTDLKAVAARHKHQDDAAELLEEAGVTDDKVVK